MPYSFLEHTADVRMRVTGKTIDELFRDALLGMVAIMHPDGTRGEEKIRRTVAIDAPDATALLIDFLNEALVWMHTEREAFTDVRFHMISEYALEAELIGYRADEFGEDIKAVTYHEADVQKDAEGVWTTNIVFDI